MSCQISRATITSYETSACAAAAQRLTIPDPYLCKANTAIQIHPVYSLDYQSDMTKSASPVHTWFLSSSHFRERRI